MRKIFYVFIIIVSVTYQSNSQVDCTLPYGCSWSGPSTITLYGCLTVQYYYSICNGKAYFKIGDITVQPPCVYYSPAQIIYDAGVAILSESWTDNLKNVLDLNDCLDGNSGYTLECYRWTGVNPGEQVELIPCHIESCCVSTWKICKTGENPDTYSYTKTGSSVGVICPRPLEPGCTSVCDQQ
jgi:hypothetical protein